MVYNNEGARLALSFRKLDFVHVDVGSGAPVPGTGSLRYLAGLGHLFTDSNFFGTTMIFTFVAFWAQLVPLPGVRGGAARAAIDAATPGS